MAQRLANQGNVDSANQVGTELRRLQRDSIVTATFGGWTREQEPSTDGRADRLERLIRELDALDQDGDSCVLEFGRVAC